MKKNAIEIKVNNWKNLSQKEQEILCLWLIDVSELLAYAEGAVDDRFTAVYPLSQLKKKSTHKQSIS